LGSSRHFDRTHGCAEGRIRLHQKSGGGSGDFITLHILDIAPARAFDPAGKVYERIDVTDLRRVALGDRWDGGVSIAKNTIRVVTTRRGRADGVGRGRG
jgi:hypothetical protein